MRYSLRIRRSEKALAYTVIRSNVVRLLNARLQRNQFCDEASLYVDSYSIDSISNGMIELATNIDLRNILIDTSYERFRVFSNDQSVEKLIRVIDDQRGSE